MQMQKSYTLLSDYNLECDLIDGLISRDLEQKFWYLDGGAKLYYDIVHIDDIVFTESGAITPHDIMAFGLQHCFSDTEKLTFISL